MIRAAACNEMEDRLAKDNLPLIDRAILSNANACRDIAEQDFENCFRRPDISGHSPNFSTGRGGPSKNFGGAIPERPAGQIGSIKVLEISARKNRD
jgi:hypothetical protein